MALAAGTRLGPYEILAPIGAGGMGEVYRAKDIATEAHGEIPGGKAPGGAGTVVGLRRGGRGNLSS